MMLMMGLTCLAQERYVQVHLKNGSTISGRLEEHVPGESLRVSTAEGSLFVLQMGEVERIDLMAPSAQPQPNGMSTDRGGRMERSSYRLLLDGQPQTDEQLGTLLGTEGFDTYCGARKQFRSGRTMLRLGWVAAGLTAASIVASLAFPVEVPPGTTVEVGSGIFIYYTTSSGSYMANPAFLALGGLNLAAACALIPMGVVFKNIGRGRLNWLADEYNAAQMTPAPKLQVGPAVMSALGPDGTRPALGVGLALSF